MQNSINDKISILRQKLNGLIEDSQDYEQIYNLSLELDKLILEYSKQFTKI